jgi:6-phosphogluconolactonase (cycloisomerase 2 family)
MWRTRQALLVSTPFPRSWMASLGLLFWLLAVCGVASAQSVQLSRTSLSFTNQAVGTTSSTLNVILTNTDAITPLTIGGITASGDYSESDNCAGSVAPSGSCTLLISFMPNSAGTLTGVITLSDDANNSPQLISTKGTGLVPLTVAPTSLAFGAVTVGSTSTAKIVTLTNSLNATVTFSFTTSGDYAAIGSGVNPCGTSLASLAACTLSVTFTPKTNGSIDGALTVSQTVDSILQIVALSGSGTGGQTPPLSFSPASLSFPSTVVGSTSADKTVLVTNNSSTTVTISTFPASTNYASAPGSASPCGGPLTAGNQCTVTVTFSPKQAGTITGSVTFSDDATINTQIVDLSGKAIGPVSVSPASLTFADQALGTTSAPETATVTNHQSTTLAIDSIIPSGDYGTVAIGTNPCGSTLPALTSCTIGVTFSPISRAGTIPGDLTVSSNAISSPQAVKLTGTTSGFLPRFAYVANAADNTISEYTVNLSTGQLRANGYVLAGAGPFSVVVAPSGKFAYVANASSHNVSAYSVNASSGTLTPVVGSPFAAGTLPGGVTVHPSGKFLYVANQGGNDVSGYTINATTGALTAITGSPFAAGQGPASVAIDPSGKFAYVNNEGGGDVSGYTIDATTGTLTAMAGSPFLSGSGALAVAIAPSGKFGYVGFSGATVQITAFSINPTTGVPTVVAGSPFFGAGGGSNVVVVDLSSKFVYAAGGSAGNNIAAFRVNATTGALTSVEGSPFAGGDNPSSATVDPTGTLLYMTNQSSNDVWAYAINPASGALTLLKTVRTQGAPASIFLSKGTTPVTYTPRFAYVADFSAATVSVFTIDYTTGALTQITGSPFPIPVEAFTVTTDPSGKFAYVTELGISAYTINATTGALTVVAGSPFSPAEPGPTQVAVDPSGRFAYVANYSSDSDVSAYTINATTGALTAVSGSPFPAGYFPFSVTVDPSGQFAYVANESDNDVSAYTINATTGALTQITGSPFAAGNQPVSVTVDPSGKFAYVANNGDNDVSAYTINATTGALTQITGSPFAAGNQPVSVTVDPSGKFAYVANIGDNDVSAYTINAATGALTQITGSPFPAGSEPRSVTDDPSGTFAYVANSGDNTVSAYTINATTGALTQITGSPFPAGGDPNSVITTGKIH